MGRNRSDPKAARRFRAGAAATAAALKDAVRAMKSRSRGSSALSLSCTVASLLDHHLTLTRAVPDTQWHRAARAASALP